MTARPNVPRPSGLRRAARVLLAVVLLTAGCSRPDDLQDVALRLGPADFGLPAPAVRGPVVQIGDEARPVVERAETITVLEKVGVPIRNGVAEVTADVPASAAHFDDGSFVLSMRRDASAETDAIAIGAAALHFIRRDHGWRARRSNDGRKVTVTVQEPGAVAGATLGFRLEAEGPLPTELLSRTFEVPPRARIVLGYGIANPPRGRPDGECVFRAQIECDGRTPELLLDDRIRFDDARAERWQTRIAELPARGSKCRLRLTTSGGRPSGSGVWAVPEILARADRAERERRNLVLISLDTLRADHLSAYGYPRATSPKMDRLLAGRGARFADVSTTYPLTSIAHMSLMTGLHPGSFPRPGSIEPQSPVRMLAESLRDAGFTTGAYTEDALLAGMYGFWFGFDRFVERPLVGEARGVETFVDGARFLREHRDQRFFLFLHTYKVHAPYVYSQRYASFAAEPDAWQGKLAPYEVPAEQQPFVDAYDRAIREVDDQVADFLAELDRLGLADDTFVVVLADHGEAFGEHGLVGHGFGAHQEQLQIPWIVRGPGVPAGTTIAEPVSIVDVAPTLLDLLGVEAPGMQGRSLRTALASGAAPPDRALSFSWIDPGAQGVRRGPWKLLEDGTKKRTLFDLANDPRERRPLDDAAEIAPLESALATVASDDRERRDRMAAAGGTGEPRAASERVLESMRALGYVE